MEASRAKLDTHASPATYEYPSSTDIYPLAQFRVLRADELPANQKRGVAFQTVSVCPTSYLPWLKTELEARGVAFVRRKVHSYGEAAALAGPGGVLVNATALGKSRG